MGAATPLADRFFEKMSIFEKILYFWAKNGISPL